MAAIVYDERDNDLLAYERRVALERENRLHAEIERLQAALKSRTETHNNGSPTMSTRQSLLQSIILETAREIPDGAATGPMYAALMGVITLNEFNTALATLIREGKIYMRGHTAYALPEAAK